MPPGTGVASVNSGKSEEAELVFSTWRSLLLLAAPERSACLPDVSKLALAYAARVSLAFDTPSSSAYVAPNLDSIFHFLMFMQRKPRYIVTILHTSKVTPIELPESQNHTQDSVRRELTRETATSLCTVEAEIAALGRQLWRLSLQSDTA